MELRGQNESRYIIKYLLQGFEEGRKSGRITVYLHGRCTSALLAAVWFAFYQEIQDGSAQSLPCQIGPLIVSANHRAATMLAGRFRRCIRCKVAVQKRLAHRWPPSPPGLNGKILSPAPLSHLTIPTQFRSCRLISCIRHSLHLAFALKDKTAKSARTYTHYARVRL